MSHNFKIETISSRQNYLLTKSALSFFIVYIAVKKKGIAKYDQCLKVYKNYNNRAHKCEEILQDPVAGKNILDYAKTANDSKISRNKMKLSAQIIKSLI